MIWLDAQGLTFGAAVAVTAAGRTTLDAVSSPPGLVALRAPIVLPAGHVALVIDYRGALDDTAPAGVFRQQSGGAWYAFTQFEATSARRAFPCFDEPDVKVPWRLTLDVPAGMVARSNAPVESDMPAAGGATHTVVFARTRPLPGFVLVLCDPALRDDVVQFFRDRLSKVAGGPRMLAMGIERMDACLARRRAAQPSIQAFLAGH